MSTLDTVDESVFFDRKVCYIGDGIVEKLKQEFDIQVAWWGVEIHPETPPEGTPMTSRFRTEDIKRMMEHDGTPSHPGLVTGG